MYYLYLWKKKCFVFVKKYSTFYRVDRVWKITANSSCLSGEMNPRLGVGEMRK